MNTYGFDLMGQRRRLRHAAEFKASVIEECLRPDVSIAAVALAHGLNANMLRKWVIDSEHKVVAPAPSVTSASEQPAMPPPTFIPLLVHDGIGIWLAARRLHEGRFVWPGGGCGAPQSLTREQVDALVLGLPWQRFGEAGVISLT